MHVQAQRDIIFELRRIAFDVECEPNNSGSMEKRKSMYTRDYKKLGFIVSLATFFLILFRLYHMCAERGRPHAATGLPFSLRFSAGHLSEPAKIILTGMDFAFSEA